MSKVVVLEKFKKNWEIGSVVSVKDGYARNYLVPNGKAKFAFRHMNVEDAFVKAKTDMIYLAEGVLSPKEVRAERGLDPEGIVEQLMETAKDVNVSGGCDQDKKEETQRTENRDGGTKKGDVRKTARRAYESKGNQPSANPTGGRK